jgi:aminoglycoside phosphotransferase (APT) family kinase protein
MNAQANAAAETVFSGTKPVEERHRFDEARLSQWMETNVADYKGPLTVTQFKGGQSNPSYRLDTPGQAYVMRRKPFGKLLKSAHAVDREYRVIAKLRPAGFPVARSFALCEDDDVIGAAFYIMEMVEGPVYWDGAMPDKTPAERRAYYEAQVATLAQLHAIDPDKAGLSDYGRPGNYFARQVDRWTKQYRLSETQKVDSFERLIEFLPRTIPAQDRVSVVHGDYRIDNMIFSADGPTVLAVLDWELSTLGDPLADFTYFVMQWIMPYEGRSGLQGLDLATLGIPSMDEAVALYCRLTDRPGVPDLKWYFAYNLFRLACISQGIAGRVRDGTASNARAVESAARAVPLANRALEFAIGVGA